MKKWRKKRFCTCLYIIQELRLDVGVDTVRRTLNRRGLFWRAVPKKTPLTTKTLAVRKQFWERYGAKSSDWWQHNIGLVFDGVTLTKAPPSLTGRQKHAAQSIGHMWQKPSERLATDVHTHNRYGIQLGVKVPLWGGFTGSGKFPMRFWTPKPKMVKDQWRALIPSMRRAIDAATGTGRAPGANRDKVWHDNEGFLLAPQVYKRNGMVSVRFPPNSGDLNPIETVWARLRKDTGSREHDDLKANKIISTEQFKHRVAQILNSYAVVRDGERYNYYQKLARGMPARLAKMKANKFGHCGK